MLNFVLADAKLHEAEDKLCASHGLYQISPPLNVQQQQGVKGGKDDVSLLFDLRLDDHPGRVDAQECSDAGHNRALFLGKT